MRNEELEGPDLRDAEDEFAGEPVFPVRSREWFINGEDPTGGPSRVASRFFEER